MRKGKLALTCSLADWETATSFAARLAIRNMAQSVSEFCLDMGLDWKAVIRGEEAEVSRLADLADIDGRILLRQSFQLLTGKYLRIGEEEVKNVFVRRTLCKACALCLAERIAASGFAGAYRGADWQFVSIRTCDRHQVALERFPGEGMPIKDYGFAFLVRRNWTMIETAAESPIHQSQSSLERYLRKRLSSRRGGSWLDQMPLSVVAKASEALGARMEHGPDATANQIDQRQWHSCGNQGFAVLSAGPKHLRSVLLDLRGTFGGGTGYHNRDLGLFYSWLDRSQRVPGVGPIREVVLDHILENYPLDPGINVLGFRVEKPRLYTWTSARQRLHIRGERLANLASDLNVDEGPAGRPMNLTSVQIAELQTKIDDLISIREAAKILGARYEQAARFIFNGMLGRREKTRGRSYLSRQEVQAFVAPVLDLDAAPTDGRLLPMKKIGSYTAASVHEIYKCFLEGRLTSAYRDPRKFGIDALLLDREEVKRALSVPDTMDPTMTAVARLLKTTNITLRYLANRGELRIYRGRHPITRSVQNVVGVEELQRFRAKFMTIGEVSCLCEIPSGPLAIKLDAARVKSRHVPHGVSRIYRRKDIQRVLDAGLHRNPPTRQR
ncbi:hypothetical protein EHS39_32545 [Ensifer sp. MPMI2T]|nr:hypothetical protein EHS39_32545 [Ensifer sp. MPMI2T]